MSQRVNGTMILLTGATGYLGSQIAQRLIELRVPFRVLVREPSRLGFEPAEVKCEVCVGDLLDDESLKKALGGASHVIHCAALVRTWVRDRRDFWRVNVEGLKRLLAAAEAAGIERVVYTSSFIALGPSANTNAGEELVHPGPFSNEYEQTKAEALVWLRAEGFRRLPVIVLLPGVIYGRGPKTQGNLVGAMIDQYVAGKFPGLLGSGEQRWSFCFNRDVAEAHLAALDKGRPGEAYLLAGDNRTLNDFFRALAALAGVRHAVHHIPLTAGKAVGAIELCLAKLFGRTPQLTPGVIEIFKHDWVYSSAKAQRELGYRVTSLEEGLARTLERLRQ